MTNDNDSGHDTRLTRREALRGGSAAAVAAGSALLSQHLVSTARAASAGDARIIMGSAPDPDTNGEISFDGTDLKAYSGGAVRNFSNIGSGGSAVEAQEDGSQLTTDTTLIDWQSGLTATNPTGDEISVNVDESEFSLSASNISDVSADSVSGAHHSKTTQAKAGTALSKSGDTLNVSGVTGSEIDLSTIAGDNVTVDSNNDELDAASGGVTQIATGTVTATGGSSPAVNTTLTGVSTDQDLDYWFTVHVDSDPAFNADYAYNYDYYHQWDDSQSELDIDLVVNWDSDPGGGNDVTLRWEVLQ